MTRYWFALSRRDESVPKEMTPGDWLRRRLTTRMTLWGSQRFYQPVTKEGRLVRLAAILAQVLGIVGLAALTQHAGTIWGLVIVLWGFLVAATYQLVAEQTADPVKTVEDYEAEDEALEAARVDAEALAKPNAPWLRWGTPVHKIGDVK